MNDFELKIITSKARADKALNSLKGILIGINIDNEVNEAEINELKTWANEHHDLINKNPFREFMIEIDEALRHTKPNVETIENLYWLTQKYEADNYYYKALTTEIQLLQGVCHGILSDGVITEKEVVELEKWLENNEHLNSYYPYDELRSLVLTITKDGKVDNEEIEVLKAYINQFVTISDKNVSSQIDIETKDINVSGLCTSDPNIIFEDKVFCITGNLKSGTRAEIQNKIKALGGLAVNNVSKKTDYLIIGDNGNQAWAFACYGRKVEAAVDLRKQGHTIVMVHEFDFIDALEDAGA